MTSARADAESPARVVSRRLTTTLTSSRSSRRTRRTLPTDGDTRVRRARSRRRRRRRRPRSGPDRRSAPRSGRARPRCRAWSRPRARTRTCRRAGRRWPAPQPCRPSPGARRRRTPARTGGDRRRRPVRRVRGRAYGPVAVASNGRLLGLPAPRKSLPALPSDDLSSTRTLAPGDALGSGRHSPARSTRVDASADSKLRRRRQVARCGWPRSGPRLTPDAESRPRAKSGKAALSVFRSSAKRTAREDRPPEYAPHAETLQPSPATPTSSRSGTSALAVRRS